MTSVNGLASGANAEFVESLYESFRTDPRSVSNDWRRFFEQLAGDEPLDGPLREPLPVPHVNGSAASNGRHAPPAAPFSSVSTAPSAPAADGSQHLQLMQEKVAQLIRAYRIRGHKIADVNPLGGEKPELPRLETDYYGFTAADLDRKFSTASLGGVSGEMTLRELVEHLRETYCRGIGVQFMHLDNFEERDWLLQRMENCRNRTKLSNREQLRILMRLNEAVIFEEFIQKRFTGAKSFSLEGAETLIPLLELAIERAGEQGVDEIVMSMAHRGRLNVLANIFGKSYASIFREFRDIDTEWNIGRGDVKYHLGHSSDWKCASGAVVHLSLCFNPSHLEFGNPVALGRVRSKQDRMGNQDRGQKIAIMIHGDAAFAGEGVVQETLNLSQLDAYRTGGSLHVVVNNQVGFTTPPGQGRSTYYATDVAKMLDAPIFHVNGEDPEAVVHTVRLAMDFRREYQRDVIIDMYCYRLHGHNEGDEPEFTQPDMYRVIRGRPSIRDAYQKRLTAMGGLTAEQADHLAEERKQQLELALSDASKDDFRPKVDAFRGYWQGYFGGWEINAHDVTTGVDREQLETYLQRLGQVPDDFKPHRKIARILKQRREAAAGERPLDWAAGEALALASLLAEGSPVRITGQDCERGTFSHRHAVLHDFDDGRPYTSLQHVADEQAAIEICNSPLSEAGVLGFEYGYSLDRPDGLVVWEAQFGDFCNAAQVVIDQFIVSAEDKWRRLSGLVLLLPHGFEGQGPEHSSARLERFLSLSAEDNIQVVNPTTPAQFFHVLRRQVVRKWRKPLVVMTPKMLLRHPRAVSKLEELTTGGFRRVLGDDVVDAGDVGRVLLCSGKIYFELAERRAQLGRDDVAIVRVEQLYPTPCDELEQALAPYSAEAPAFWVQEEPENMGAWRFLKCRFGDKLFGRPFSRVSRPESASPATGAMSSHKLEQERILDEAFGAWPNSD